MKTRQAYAAIIVASILLGAVRPGFGTPSDLPAGSAARSDDVRANGTKAAVESPKLQLRNERYRIATGDVLDLTFPLTAEFNQAATVQPDGYITLSGIGDLLVAGSTVPEVRSAVERAYAKVLHDPIVTIVLKEFVKPYFVASGEVGRPGKYEMLKDTTLTEAIAIAGGLNEASKHSQVLLFRRVSGEWAEVKQIDVKEIMRGKTLREDIHLQPGDMVVVPQNRISKVKKWIPIPSLATGIHY